MINKTLFPIVIGLALLQIYLYLPQQTTLANFFTITLLALWALMQFGGQILNKIEATVKIVKTNFTKEPLLVSIGIVFAILYIVELQVSIYIELLGDTVNLSWLFWLSNILPLILIYSFIFLNKTYATAGLLSATLYESSWSIDFIGRAIFNVPPFGGIADYMFQTYPFHFFINLNHLFFIPLFFYGIIRMGVAKNAYLICMKVGLLIMTVTWIFTKQEDNINCLYHSCLKFIPLNLSPIFNLLFLIIVPQLLILAPLNWFLYTLYYRFKKPSSRHGS